MTDSDIPPGWDHNPSTWRQRWPIIGLAGVGFLIASYLALYQYGVIGTVWEPFFGDGSQKILHSWVSDLLPVSDATLGAMGYIADMLTGAIGSTRRWRTMPWLVLLFGLLVGPLGAVSITLVIFQPVFFHGWCTLCLASAAISITMIGPAMGEILASLQFLRREHGAGRSVWRALWHGSEPEVQAK